MANPWFRMYSEFMHDPKVQMMSEQYQRRLLMLLCMRCNSDVTLQDKYVTFTLRISEQEWVETKAQFVALGFIDLDNNVMNWNKRQFVSDSSASRVAKHRALHKSDDVTVCNVTVTPPEHNRTDSEHNRAEKSTVVGNAERLPCPVEKIVDSYHRLMPNNPACKVINAGRRAAIKSRWIEASKLECVPFGYSNQESGVRAWESFFEICNQSEFLTGKSKPRQEGAAPFFATIDFLFSPSGFVKCLENKYHAG